MDPWVMRTLDVHLTKLDTCDRCGAAAKKVTVHENGRLYWCQHCYNAVDV